MIILYSFYDVSESALQNNEYVAGAIYFCRDTGNLYVDSIVENTRVLMSKDLIVLPTENSRVNILAPIPNKIYIVIESGSLYIYDNSWVKIGPPEQLRFSNITVSNGSAIVEDSTIKENDIGIFIPDLSVADICGNISVTCSDGEALIKCTSEYDIPGELIVGVKGSFPINEKINAIEKSLYPAVEKVDSLSSYSTEPKKIGNWVDGTPIWRVGFDIPISEGEISVDIPLYFNGDGIKVINCDCFSNAGNLVNTYSRKSEISFGDGIMNISYTNDSGDTSLYGWVEFLQYEKNIEEYFSEYRQSDGTYKLTGRELNDIVIHIPLNYIGMDNIRFTVAVKAASGQDIDILYGDSSGVKLSSFTAGNNFEVLELSNAGYPATLTSYFKMRCHSTENDYVILKNINIEVI